MKRILSLILSFAILLTMPGCATSNGSTNVVAVKSQSITDLVKKKLTHPETTAPTESEIPIAPENDPADLTDTVVENGEPTNSLTANVDNTFFDEEIKFTGMGDEKLLSYIEDSVYTQLKNDLNSTDYFIEDVSAVYISEEYINELVYNSQTNVFFGYSLAELDSFFEGTRYVFTLGEDGNTTVEPLQTITDTSYQQMLTNVAIGTGVILVCVTVSAVTAGTAAPAVSMIFAVATKTAAVGALSGAGISGITAAVVRGYQTGDLNEALKAGAVGATEGYKWGAISGAISGGAGEAFQLYRATGNGLTMNQVALIQQESGYPLSLIKQFHTMEEYNVFKDAGLNARMVGGKLTLVRQDIDLFGVTDEFGRNNYTRMAKGLNPVDKAGKTFEWHHIGQEKDATLALLTPTEHDNGALHGFKIVSEIDRKAFEAYKKELNKSLLKLLLTT